MAKYWQLCLSSLPTLSTPTPFPYPGIPFPQSGPFLAPSPLATRSPIPLHPPIACIPFTRGYAGTRDYTRGCGGEGSLWGSGYRVPAYTLTYRPGVVWSEKKAEGGWGRVEHPFILAKNRIRTNNKFLQETRFNQLKLFRLKWFFSHTLTTPPTTLHRQNVKSII